MIYAGIILLGALFVMSARASNGESFTVKKNFSDKYDSLFRKYGATYGIDPLVLKTIAANESSVGENPRVKIGIEHPDQIYNSVPTDGKSWGLMQVTLSTARQFEKSVTEVDLNNPEVSVRLAAKYINWVMRNYGSDLEYVVRSYNGGPAWKKTKIGPAATQVYWSHFLANYEKIKADGI